jgi:hypothetical protein
LSKREGDIEPLIRMLERAAKPYPFLDPDYDILILEESEKPLIIMNREEYNKLWEKITGAPIEEQ